MRAARRLGEYKKARTYNTPPSYIGKGSYSYSSSTISVGVPADIVEGDLLLIFVSCYGTNYCSTPDGWTLLNHAKYEAGANDVYFSVFYKFRGSSQGSVSIGDNGSQMGVMLAFRGVDQINPIDVNGTDTDSGTTFSANAITTTVNNCMVVCATGFNEATPSRDTSNYSSWANSALASITECCDNFDTTAGIAAAYGVKETAGATSATTATTDDSTNLSAIVSFALTPAA